MYTYKAEAKMNDTNEKLEQLLPVSSYVLMFVRCIQFIPNDNIRDFSITQKGGISKSLIVCRLMAHIIHRRGSENNIFTSTYIQVRDQQKWQVRQEVEHNTGSCSQSKIFRMARRYHRIIHFFIYRHVTSPHQLLPSTSSRNASFWLAVRVDILKQERRPAA